MNSHRETGMALATVMGRNESITIHRPRQINEDGDFSEWSVWGDKQAASGPTLGDALWALMRAIWVDDDAKANGTYPL